MRRPLDARNVRMLLRNRAADFWAYHDALFGDQDEIGLLEWEEFAVMAGVPAMDEFASCLDRQDSSSRIVSDSLASRRIGIAGTPTFLINDRLYRGALMPGPLKEAVLEQLRG